MSYDISLNIKTGDNTWHEIYDDNYTYNVSPMFYDVIEGGLNALHGMNAHMACPILASAVAKLSDPENKAKYGDMNPSNGWGNHEGATKVLVDLWNACKEHNFCTIEIY